MMKKLIAAVVFAGTLSVASPVMGYGDVYVEYRDREGDFGAWFVLPLPRAIVRHRGWRRERRWDDRWHRRHRRHHHRREPLY